MFFALYVQAIRPFVISKSPTTETFLISFLAFLLLFPMYSRFKQDWNKWLKILLRFSGWVAGIFLLMNLNYPDGSGFSFYRNDIIIVVLANMALFGSFVWLFTQNNLLIRIGILGILLAIRLSNMPVQIEGWVSQIWNYSPIPWVYRLYYLQYLFIVIPGMIGGEIILNWLKKIDDEKQTSWSQTKYVLVIIIMFSFVLILLVGMYNRWLVETTILTFLLIIVTLFVHRSPLNSTEVMYRNLFFWAAYWLVLGLFFEPFEGGIKKDKATLSYYFITSGLAICTLIFFSILIDIFKKKKLVSILIYNGQNPMIAYAGVNNLIIPVLYLTGLMNLLNKLAITPWLGFVKGLIVTFLLALSVSLFTRLKIFWRT